MKKRMIDSIEIIMALAEQMDDIYMAEVTMRLTDSSGNESLFLRRCAKKNLNNPGFHVSCDAPFEEI